VSLCQNCILHRWHSKFIRATSDSRKWHRCSQMISTPLKAPIRTWFWFRRFKFSKLEEGKGAIRSLVPLDVFKLQEITVDGRIPVVRGPKFQTLRLHLTSRSIRVYSIRVHIFVTRTSVPSNRLKSKCFTSASFYSNFCENYKHYKLDILSNKKTTLQRIYTNETFFK